MPDPIPALHGIIMKCLTEGWGLVHARDDALWPLYTHHIHPCFLSVVVVSFSPQNYSVLEGTPADIMIVLDQLSPKNITINVTTMDITAQGTFVLYI